MRQTVDADAFLAGFGQGEIGCCITDPPWDLTRNGGGGGRFDECASYERMDPGEIAALFGRHRHRFQKGAHLYVFAPAGAELGGILVGFTSHGWELQRVLAWDRVTHRGLGAYRNAWEPVLIFSNGRAKPYNKAGTYPSLLSFKSQEYRTAKPWKAYRIFMDMSARDGAVTVDPFCGTNPLQAAAESFTPPKPWAAADVVPAEQIRAEVAARKRARHSGHPSRRVQIDGQSVLLHANLDFSERGVDA